jgi:hypothetical protein
VSVGSAVRAILPPCHFHLRHRDGLVFAFQSRHAPLHQLLGAQNCDGDEFERFHLVRTAYHEDPLRGGSVVRCSLSGFHISPHAWQRQYVEAVITFASVPTAFDSQNGHAAGR